MTKDFVKSTLVGFAVIGDALGENAEKAINTITMIITNNYDFELKCAAYHTYNQKIATSEEQLESENVVVHVNKIKSFFRKAVQNLFNESINKEKEELIESMKETHKPHVMGTVAEIAAKYGISKSEVRRRKVEGTLEELEKIDKN